MMALMMLVNYLVLVVGVLVGVASVILLERKFLGYIQIGKGANKGGHLGMYFSLSQTQ